MPNILHLGKFYPPDNGGIESVTATLARSAAAAGMPTTVLCFEEHGRGDMRDQGVVVRRVPAVKVASQPLCWAYLREGIALARKADIVHVHLPNMLAAMAVARIGAGPKVVLHWHSDVVGKGLLAQLTRPLERAMLRRSDKIICTSQPYADSSVTLKPFIDKVVVIPIGVADVPVDRGDAASLMASLPSTLRQHIGGRPLVLAVGRLVPYKGYTTLIEASKQLKTNAAVVVVGSGPLAMALQAQIDQLGSAHRVLLAGRVEAPDLLSLQSLATVFCMPSVERAEAFGVAMVEAMAFGLPIVATQIAGSGVPWVNLHGSSGLNVRPGDTAGLAAALDSLLQDAPLRQHLATGARQRFTDLFTVQRSIDETLDLYRDLLA